MKGKLLPIAALLCAAAAVIMAVMLFTGGEEKNFTPPAFDESAQTGVPSVPEDAGYAQADAEAFQFAAAGSLQVRDRSVDVWLTNPAGNGVWLKVRILDENGQTLGESGLVKENEYVQSVTLDTIPQNSGNVSLKIMAYEPDTYYSAGAAVLNTKLRIS